MRPSRLALENFGPYRVRAEIDFTLLGQVFLVCGQTGSGKTSLFDAMTYALYGKAPGTRSGLERQLWSHHSRPGERPLVEFEFFLGCDEYRIVRCPPYRRRSQRRKEEYVEVDSEAAFFRRERTPGGPEWKLIANSKTEVDAAVEARMGLTEDEFSKIILLPQGEFQRFLEMKSSDRVEVLEKLFPVRMHDAVAVLAKDKARAALADVQRVDAALARLGGATVAEAEDQALGELAAEVRRLEAERAQAIAGLSAAELAQARAKESAARAARVREAGSRLEALLALSAEAAARDQRISAARRAVPVLAAIEAREGLDAELEAALSKLGERRALIAELASRELEMSRAREEAAKRADEIAAADRELGELEVAGKAWAEAEAARLEIERKRSETAAVSARLAAAREAELRALEARDATAVGSEEEAAIRASFESDRASATVAEAAQKEAESVTALAEKADKLRRASAAAAAEASTASERLAEAVRSLAALEAAESANLAGRLALGLAPGEMCPVCGSREHPAIASSDKSAHRDLADTERALSLAREAREAAREAEADSRAGAKSAEVRAMEAEEELGGLAKGHFATSLSEARETAKAASVALAVSAERLREMEKRRAAFSRLEAAVENARVSRGEAEAEAQKAALELARLESTLLSAASGAGLEDPGPRAEAARERRDRASTERSRLDSEYSSWASGLHEAEALASELDARVEDIRLRLDEARRAEAYALAEAGFEGPQAAREARIERPQMAALEAVAAAYRGDLAAARAAVEAIAEEVSAAAVSDGGGAAVDELTLAAAVRSAKDSRDEIQGKLDEARAKLDALGRARDERARLLKERGELDASWSRMNALSVLLNGEMPGRRLPFKNYALGAYFRVVVGRASERLAQMSDGRFALAADEGSGRGKAGLELLVRDAHTGQSRPAGTLSGGERFLTSLSLALGLSDTIRERSGGASLDAIFIDEGFGSLDDEALDRAISVLDEARGARTIGIVSHLAELKARMPSRIEVSKGRSGSSVRMVY